MERGANKYRGYKRDNSKVCRAVTLKASIRILSEVNYLQSSISYIQAAAHRSNVSHLEFRPWHCRRRWSSWRPNPGDIWPRCIL